MKGNIAKRILTVALSAAMMLTGIPAAAFASDNAGAEEAINSAAAVGMEEGKTYLVPLSFYRNDEPYWYFGYSDGIMQFMDNVALVSKNSNGTYHVTVQIENYDKIEALQFSKPGAISEDVKPSEALMGTYNFPESFIMQVDTAETVRGNIASKISEEWNDKYIQDVTVEKGSDGVSWCSFDVDTLDQAVYVKTFRSYKATYRKKQWSYTSCIDSNKFTFDVDQASDVNSIETLSQQSIGLEAAMVSDKTGANDFYSYAVKGNTAAAYFMGETSVSMTDGQLQVTATLTDVENISSVQVLEGINDIGSTSTSKAENTLFQEYICKYSAETVNDNTISVYSDNILSDGKITVNYANIYEAAFGKQLKIQTTDGNTYYMELRVKNEANKELRLTDNGVTVITDSYNVGSSNPTFTAELLEENTDENSEYNKYYSLLAGSSSKALIYNLSVDVNGETIKPTRAVEMRIKIPEDWDTSRIEVQWYFAPVYQIFNPIEYFDETSYTNEDGSIHMEGDELVITGTTRVYNTIAITEKSQKADISEIQDGVYNVNVTMWQLAQPDRLSMSNSVVVADSARLVVENGKKYIYFDTQGITIGGIYGYTNGIYWANNEQTDTSQPPVLSSYTQLDYYSYYLNDAGSTDMDSYAKDYDLYYPKAVGFELPESADRDDGVYLDFWVPIMDELQNVQPGSGGGSRTAFMTLSGLTQVAEIDGSVHDKSVLVVAVDKASKYLSDDYTEESYKALSDAVVKAQKVIDGTTSANDSEITALDSEIAEAISSLKEATGLDKYNKVLKNAKALNEADYTAESWADLQAVIDAQTGKVTEDNADSAVSELKAAIDALVETTTAVSLEEGVYEVQAAFNNQDGTTSDLNTDLESARLYVDQDGSVTAYLYTDGITGLEYRKGAGYEAAVKEADAGRFVICLPANVENHKIKVTTENSETELLLNLDLKSAVKQDIKISALESKLEKAKALKEKNYTSDSFTTLKDAIAAAECALADKVAFQAEITAAETALDTATAGLVIKEEVKARAELDQAVSDAKNNYAEANYTKDSYEKLESAIKEAEEVLSKSDATADEMKEQVDKLDKAEKALIRLDDAADKSELNETIEKAEAKVNDGTYTDNSWNSFQTAIKSAKKVSADVNATKAEVEKQTKLLNSSYEGLVVKNKQSTLFEDYPQIFEGTYSVPIRLVNATSDEDSMGNASMAQTGIVKVTDKGEVTLEMNFQSMKFAGMTGYLYKLKKVDMDSVVYNKYNYPTSYEAEDAAVLAEYTDVYDLFNNKSSDYYDKNTEGNWYPKTLSIPINLNDNLFYVEVYVPVMESIGAGQGTKVARVSIDWANIKQETGVERDNSVIEALLNQVSGMQQGDVADEYWNALNAAYVTAQDVYNDMNSTQKEIDLQVKALQAAVDAVETQIADKTELNALIEKAAEEANRTDVIYTSATLETLKTAINNAQTVSDDENATKAEIQAQLTALQKAIDGLRAVDKTKLNELIEKAKAEAEKTDTYESSSLTVLNAAITLGESVAANINATESDVAAAEKALTTALNGLTEKENVDKSTLKSKIAEANGYLSQIDIYTESSLDTLKSAVNRAQNVMDNASASQSLVDTQVTKLTEAISQLAKKSDEKLDINNLADGVYSVYGTMVKVDKNTYSMSNEAINHTIKLTVKDGKYYITMNFNGLTVGQKMGYLSQLKYFTTGYTVDKYGNPQGTLGDVTVDSYQKNSDGSLVSDQYGTNYPDEVTFELIPEALNDGYVPLQVFVPIMDAISEGTGTQPVFLKLDWSTIKQTTDDDPSFDNNDNDNNNNDNGGNGNNGTTGTLPTSTLSTTGGSKLSSSSLSGTTGSSLKSASSVKTGDIEQNYVLYISIALLGAVLAMAGVMSYKKKRN